MSEEFTKTAPGTAVSGEGFSIEVQTAGGIIYRDSTEEIFVDSERVLRPSSGMVINRNSHLNKRLMEQNPAKIDEVLRKIVRALKFLGFNVEFD
jgi:hypothetical protein